MIDEKVLIEKFAVTRPLLGEKQWRLYLACEAQAIGWDRFGGPVVGRIPYDGAGGVAEIRAGVRVDGRVRAPGAGRPPVEEVLPGIESALRDLVSPATRGDPESPLSWTTKSLSQLAKGLAGKGFRVGCTAVSRLLKQAGYRLQATFKTKEGAQHPTGTLSSVTSTAPPDSSWRPVIRWCRWMRRRRNWSVSTPLGAGNGSRSRSMGTTSRPG
nr:hypothetical protein [Actinoplanes sp. NBRC 103695]